MEKIETKLIKEGWINPNQLIKVKHEMSRTKKSLFATIIKYDFMTEEDVYTFFANETNVPFVRLADYKVDEEVLRLFPEQFCRENILIPLFRIENTFYICMATPLDTDLINTLEIKTNMEIAPLFGSPSEILKTLDKYCGPDDRYFNLENLIIPPQLLNMIPFWRESERISVNIPVEFKSDDKRVSLVSSSYISGTALDVSRSGRAMGIRTVIFVPPQTSILIKFPSYDPAYEIKSVAVRCAMERGGKYLMGVKFSDIKDDLIRHILKDADSQV